MAQACPNHKNSEFKPFEKGRNLKSRPPKRVGFSCKNENPRSSLRRVLRSTKILMRDVSLCALKYQKLSPLLRKGEWHGI